MRRTRAAAVLVLALALLGGCGLFSSDDDPSPSTSTASTADGTEPEQDGPTPEELSAQVLDAAEATTSATPLGSGTGTTKGGNQVTIEVLAVQRLETATLVRMQISGEQNDLGGPAHFADERYDAANFARTLYLVDAAVSGTRYLPLQFDDYRQACTCPYFPLENGEAPQVVTALFPSLPEGVTTVDLDANGFLAVTGLPVEG